MILNIGVQGACLRLPAECPPGARLRMDFTLAQTHLQDVEARVIWTRREEERALCGVEFAEPWPGRVQQALLNPQHQVILLVEDELGPRNALERSLVEAGYAVSVAGTIGDGKRLFAERPFDTVVLDLNLPDGDGMDLLETIRAHSSRAATPVVILTADARPESKLAGLAFGADHYLAKPVDAEEMLFWVTALLRRAGHGEREAGVIRFERGQIDPVTHTVRIEGREIGNLSRKEFDLLYQLIASRPRILSKRFILAKLWHTVLTDNTVEAHVKRLRDKLGPQAAFRVTTVSGKGYRFI